VRDALRAFKFEGRTGLAGPLGDLAVEVCAAHLPVPPEIVVPVPLARARERERGFNQAGLLAARIARGLGLPAGARLIRRIRATAAQAELTAAERRTNVRGAFAVRDGVSLRGRNALLVDDVLTTGATASECARVMLAAGALTVGVLTVARAV
jgi:ComF family protein